MVENFDHIFKEVRMAPLTLKEEIILSSLLMLEGNSSGAPLRKKVIEISCKNIVYGTLYNHLEGLIRKGYVTSAKSDPRPVQGGRSQTIYRITKEGIQALGETFRMHESIRKKIEGFESGL